MKIKKSIYYFLTLTLMSCICLLKTTPAFADEKPIVKLTYAKANIVDWGPYNPGPDSVPYQVHGYISGAIELKKLASPKNVVIHYTEDGVTWNDINAEYASTTENNYEAWTFKTPIQHSKCRGSVYAKFCVKYEVDGKTYWDNNDGQNYSVSSGFSSGPEIIMPGTNVNLFSFSKNLYNSSYRGVIKVKNLAPNKEIKVRYSTDDWQSYNEAYAHYTSEGSSLEKSAGIETWEFEIPSYQNLKLAVSYDVNGVTYWDNNFGANYQYSNSRP